jgi:uncharacterized protein (DUF2147 family)
MFRYILVWFPLWLLAAEPITGFWKTIDEQGLAQSVIAIYEYKGLCYGRIIGTFDERGHMKEHIYAPKERAPGLVDHPHYCGLDIIWDLEDRGLSFRGKILDPQKGNVYRSEVWIDHDDLMVRGKWLCFGRTQRWVTASSKDFPQGFTKPSLETFVPQIPLL